MANPAIPYNIPAGYKYFIVHSNLRLTADIQALSYCTANGLGTPSYLGSNATGFFLWNLLGGLLGADTAWSYMAPVT